MQMVAKHTVVTLIDTFEQLKCILRYKVPLLILFPLERLSFCTDLLFKHEFVIYLEFLNSFLITINISLPMHISTKLRVKANIKKNNIYLYIYG